MQQTALVSGGAGGLGTAVTRALLAAGWRVVAPVRGRDGLDRLRALHAAAVGASEQDTLVPIEADLNDPEAVARCVEVAGAQPARPLRAVVNLVGGFAAGGRVHETPVEQFEAAMRLNLRPTYLVCHAALPHLLAARGGAIVCVSSQAVRTPFAGAAGYLTAKTAVLGLVGALHAEYAADGVRVNAILPKVIDTPANRAAQPDADRRGWTPPERIAQTVAFLCDDASAAVRGSHIPV